MLEQVRIVAMPVLRLDCALRVIQADLARDLRRDGLADRDVQLLEDDILTHYPPVRQTEALAETLVSQKKLALAVSAKRKQQRALEETCHVGLMAELSLERSLERGCTTQLNGAFDQWERTGPAGR